MRDEKILRVIGRNLQKARLEAGLTQECLAEMADIHWKTLGYIETGRRSTGIASFARLIQSLNVDPRKLFAGLPATETKRIRAIVKAQARKRKTSAKLQ